MFYIISRYKSKKAFVPIGCKSIKYFPKKIFFGVKGVYGICLEKKVFLFSTCFVNYRLSPSTAERSCSSAFAKLREAYLRLAACVLCLRGRTFHRR